jgi:hypothetical protein
MCKMYFLTCNVLQFRDLSHHEFWLDVRIIGSIFKHLSIKVNRIQSSSSSMKTDWLRLGRSDRLREGIGAFPGHSDRSDNGWRSASKTGIEEEHFVRLQPVRAPAQSQLSRQSMYKTSSPSFANKWHMGVKIAVKIRV